MFMGYSFTMITTVTTKNMISIPAEIGRRMGIKPGFRLDWEVAEDRPETLTARVIPDRGALAARLFGKGKGLAAGRDVIAELIREREKEDHP
jgi:AbrB family looped-hinge helix DNA binding protein